MHLIPELDSTKIIIETDIPDVGPLLLWVPEAIASNTGNSAVYPVGLWVTEGSVTMQQVSGTAINGPGNAPIVDDVWYECAGKRFPVDSPVEWKTRVETHGNAVCFRITMKNVGPTTIMKAGAAICLSFLGAHWWSDSNTYVSSNGEIRSLSELGRDAGKPNNFQAYLLDGESYDHEFYHWHWGISKHTVDRAVMVSEHCEAGICIGVESNSAYFIHSNCGNPCTDMMLAFADLAPGDTADVEGTVWIRTGRAGEAISG
jgi:hypothetical protein